MQLVQVYHAGESAWDSALMHAPGGGHFLQSFAWGTVKQRYHWTPLHFILRDDAGRICGAAQVLAYRTPLGRRLLYCPKGPWIDWHDQRAVHTLLEGLGRWGRRHGAFALRFDPHIAAQDRQARQCLEACAVTPAPWEMQYKTGWVVDLRGSEEDVLGAMKPKTRYNTRLAERKGVRIVHDSSPEALEAFYALYAETAERDGFPPRSKHSLLHSTAAMLQSGRGAVLWAEHEGTRLAASIVYSFGDKAWYWLGASSSQGRHLMPAYLVQWEGMRWARARQCTRYDMTGVPSVDTLKEDDPFWGLYRFKSGFGGGAEELVGTCELEIDPVVNRLWHSIEPLYYRVYQRLRHDVYY